MAMSRAWDVPGATHRCIAAKGAPEAIASLCRLAPHEQARIHAAVKEMAARGLRVLAVAKAEMFGKLPEDQGSLPLAFLGLVGLADPLRPSVPDAIMLLLTGHAWKGIILLGLGTAVIGTIDNIVRPLIVHKGVRLHPILVFFSLLGGLRLFGVLGLFVGPVIVSVTAALLEMFTQDIVPNPRNESKEIGSER
jgi:AI-2E family transporter